MSVKIQLWRRKRQEAAVLLRRGSARVFASRQALVEQVGTFDPMLRRTTNR